MDKTGQNRPKMALNGLKLYFFEKKILTKMDKIGQKWTKTDKKWTKMVKYEQNEQKNIFTLYTR